MAGVCGSNLPSALAATWEAARRAAEADIEAERAEHEAAEMDNPQGFRRADFLKRMERLSPGNRAGIHVLQVDGELITDEKAIEEALRKHWE